MLSGRQSTSALNSEPSSGAFGIGEPRVAPGAAGQWPDVGLEIDDCEREIIDAPDRHADAWPCVALAGTEHENLLGHVESRKHVDAEVGRTVGVVGLGDDAVDDLLSGPRTG